MEITELKIEAIEEKFPEKAVEIYSTHSFCLLLSL